MLDRIMRSLGYVPEVILTDVHNHAVQLDNALAMTRAELRRVYDKIEDDKKHHNAVVNIKNTTIADLQEACRNYQKLTGGARVVSVYVYADKPAREVRLMLAGISKADESFALPIRRLMLSKKNSDQLMQEADAIAAGFGIPNTSVPTLT